MEQLPIRIDLNGDMGESFGMYRLGQDDELVRYVTSANIACGFHAGDPGHMVRTVRSCLQAGVSIGAHPGLPDLQGFGRRNMAVTPQEAYELILYQGGALQAIARAEGGRMRHVKPHGALYNMAAVQRPLADAIAEAVLRLDPELTLFGLAGSELIRAAESKGLRTAAEAFADRTYRADGTLTPRSEPDAVIHDPRQAVRQVLDILKRGEVLTPLGEAVALRADTFCIHGDGPDALELARTLRQQLLEEGVSVQAP
ncbi:LamB/YcsF family protein [Paenibacillus validus]|uniref:LamB/YcsF family protein n=1 Tax=Paenibacillus validus TaxID=44253 RepID=UPI0022A933B0|nr:5-oxoprolinase subunit PxpA [Paenibacillus validus]